jgi:transcriptional regulator with XRE-family HTH domain
VPARSKLGQAIRSARERNALTQREMATLAGVSTTTIDLWENAMVIPKPSNLRHYCGCTGADWDTMFELREKAVLAREQQEQQRRRRQQQRRARVTEAAVAMSSLLATLAF